MGRNGVQAGIRFGCLKYRRPQHETASNVRREKTRLMTPTHRIAVVIGSTRPTRICADVAHWARDQLAEGSAQDYEILDLADIDLPFLDEPLKAALHEYAHEHTRAWSRMVAGYDGFFFVFPQYNWGYPAVLKNALDYLYQEWRGKPASLLTYGTRGGHLAADQLIQVLRGLRMEPLDSHAEAITTADDVDDGWQLRDVEATLRPTRPQLATIDHQFTEALRATQEG
jgi:NAD(P)H-dependent FMN reductase